MFRSPKEYTLWLIGTSFLQQHNKLLYLFCKIDNQGIRWFKFIGKNRTFTSWSVLSSTWIWIRRPTTRSTWIGETFLNSSSKKVRPRARLYFKRGAECKFYYRIDAIKRAHKNIRGGTNRKEDDTVCLSPRLRDRPAPSRRRAINVKCELSQQRFYDMSDECFTMASTAAKTRFSPIPSFAVHFAAET